MKTSLIIAVGLAIVALIVALFLHPVWPVAVALIAVLSAAVLIAGLLASHAHEAALRREATVEAISDVKALREELTALRTTALATWKGLDNRVESIETWQRTGSKPGPFGRVG